MWKKRKETIGAGNGDRRDTLGRVDVEHARELTSRVSAQSDDHDSRTQLQRLL
jgi:hypothetical protein